MLGHKSSLSKFKKIEIISTIFSDHNAMRLEINYREKNVKNTSTWRLNKQERQQTTSVGENVEKREPSCTLGGNVNWYSHYAKQYGGCQKVKNGTTIYDPAIPFLDTYPKKTKTLIQKDICTPKFMAALFTIAKIQMQPKCPLIDKWIKMCVCVCVYTFHVILFSHKKE